MYIGDNMPGEVGQGKQWEGPSERVSQLFFFIGQVDGSGRVTIPSTLRTILGINSSDYVRVHVTKLSEVPGGETAETIHDHIQAAKARRHVDE